MKQFPKPRRVRGYRIHIFCGAAHQPPSITTPTMWREQPPVSEWQQMINDPATVRAHMIRSGRKMRQFQFRRSSSSQPSGGVSMATLAVRRLSSDAKTFVAFMLRYFGTSRVRELDARTDNSRWQYVTSEVVRIAHQGDYEQVPTSFEMLAYYLSWVLTSGRVNGATHLATRQMEASAILQLIAAIRERKLHGNEVARFLMASQWEGSR